MSVPQLGEILQTKVFFGCTKETYFPSPLAHRATLNWATGRFTAIEVFLYQKFLIIHKGMAEQWRGGPQSSWSPYHGAEGQKLILKLQNPAQLQNTALTCAGN